MHTMCKYNVHILCFEWKLLQLAAIFKNLPPLKFSLPSACLLFQYCANKRFTIQGTLLPSWGQTTRTLFFSVLCINLSSSFTLDSYIFICSSVCLKLQLLWATQSLWSVKGGPPECKTKESCRSSSLNPWPTWFRILAIFPFLISSTYYIVCT